MYRYFCGTEFGQMLENKLKYTGLLLHATGKIFCYIVLQRWIEHVKSFDWVMVLFRFTYSWCSVNCLNHWTASSAHLSICFGKPRPLLGETLSKLRSFFQPLIRASWRAALLLVYFCRGLRNKIKYWPKSILQRKGMGGGDISPDCSQYFPWFVTIFYIKLTVRSNREKWDSRAVFD